MHRVAGIIAVKDNLSTPEAAATRHLDETANVIVRDTLEQPPLHERILADASPGGQTVFVVSTHGEENRYRFCERQHDRLQALLAHHVSGNSVCSPSFGRGGLPLPATSRAGGCGNKVRLYDGTGLGTFVITEKARNFGDLFELPSILDAYRSGI